MSGSVELFANIDITPKTRTDIVPEHVERCAHIDMVMMNMMQTQNCRMSESVELCAHIGMMIMLIMQFKNAEYQDL